METTTRPDNVPGINPEALGKLARWRMPFGRYKGRVLLDLPEPYVVWFVRNGVPRGEFGRLMALLYEVKLNGLEDLLEPFRSSSDD
jgi:uncharacterized protein (DUF3820 family)